MEDEILLFELKHGAHTWRLWSSGRAEGFPEGTVMINHALPFIFAARCDGSTAFDVPPVHASDCALHNAPAYPPGPCDCGANASG